MSFTVVINPNNKIKMQGHSFDGWYFENGNLISDTGKIYTAGKIQLLEWKSAFYDRGKRVIDIDDFMPERK